MNIIEQIDDNICPICGEEILQWHVKVKYDGDICHINCAVEDEVGLDMDRDFGASS